MPKPDSNIALELLAKLVRFGSSTEIRLSLHHPGPTSLERSEVDLEWRELVQSKEAIESKSI